MKIEFEIGEIFPNEEGEGLEDTIRREVIAQLIAQHSGRMKTQIAEITSKAITDTVTDAVSSAALDLVENTLDTEYTPVDKYGSKSAPTTIRKQIHAALVSQMEYKKCTYDSDKNAFSKAVDQAISDKMNEFKKKWRPLVDGKFVQEAMAYATKTLQDRLGVKP